MEIYDTEEEQVEALKRWWKENGLATVIGVIVGIAIILGWNFWHKYKQEQALQASALYEQLLTAAAKDQFESADQIAERMKAQFSGLAYGTYAALIQAELEVRRQDLDAAAQILEQAEADADSGISHVARLRLIRILLAQGKYEQGLQLIAEADSSSAAGFSGAYEELKGDLYLALERLDEARTAYQTALMSGYQSPLLQLKLDDLTPAEILPASDK